MAVLIIVQVVMIVMGSKECVVSFHFISDRDWHAGGRVLWRWNVPHPQSINVSFLTDVLFKYKLITLNSIEDLRGFQWKVFGVWKDGLDRNAIFLGSVHLKTNIGAGVAVHGDWCQFQRDSITPFIPQLVSLDHSSIIIDSWALCVTVVPTEERLRYFGVRDVQSPSDCVVGIPFRGFSTVTCEEKIIRYRKWRFNGLLVNTKNIFIFFSLSIVGWPIKWTWRNRLIHSRI